MATRFATGLAKGKDSATVAADAVRQAKQKLPESSRVDLAIVYASRVHDYPQVVAAVRNATGKAPLIGSSSAGEFTEERIETASVAVGLISSDDIRFFTAMAEGVKDDPELAVRSLANRFPLRMEGFPHFSAILLVDGLAGVGEEITILASYVFEQVLGERVKLVGGCAGDDMQFKETFVFSDDRVATNAVSVCLLASRMPLFTAVRHGHIPLSKPLKATRANGNVLYEVDGRPAWEVWKEETAQAVKDSGIILDELDESALTERVLGNYELGLPTEIEGEYKIRLPLAVGAGGSLSFSCGIAEGSTFRIMDGSNLENLINAAAETATLAKQSAEDSGFSSFAGLLVFECGVRLTLLGNDFPRSVERYKNALPGTPMLGWETYGEIRMESGQFSGFHNTTSVVLLIPEV